jgi:GNAT superfamily N-acetyltransferase
MLIRQMTTDDIPTGMGLKSQAGWNQTPADWRRFLSLDPEGCFVAEWEGRSVGTTTTCVFDAVGWIAMVLVDTGHRHRGIGTRLVQHAIAHLERRGVDAIRLDATPLGRPIYEQLGFVAQYDLYRWQGAMESRAVQAAAGEVQITATAAGKSDGSLADGTLFRGAKDDHAVPTVFSPDRLDAVCALDRRVTHVDRRRLLARLVQEQPRTAAIITDGEHVAGYAMVRPGSRARQIGPAASLTPESGVQLADWTLACCAGDDVFVDIPADNQPATQWVRSKGLSQQRVLTRMCRGQTVCEDVTRLWASSGPEKG